MLDQRRGRYELMKSLALHQHVDKQLDQYPRWIRCLVRMMASFLELQGRIKFRGFQLFQKRAVLRNEVAVVDLSLLTLFR